MSKEQSKSSKKPHMQDLWSQAIRVATAEEHDQQDDSVHSSDTDDYEKFNKFLFEGGDGNIGQIQNANQNGHGANTINGEDGAGATQQPRRTKKEARKIPRYESASIDEEEFQDYFTNPIKRKEFDRQRKKQQMREMQNITGFTLGQFGIKSMKAMKEALPAYPDDDDVPNDGDSQKNYATVSLCCLSVTNPFRNKIIQIVSVNPWFDRLILFVILVNCLFLALDKEVAIVTENIDHIDFVFLIIYTWEMMMKIIAMGFFMRAHSYLRDSWNIMDFSVVVLGWISSIINSENISAIKVIRILRPLRTINQIPNMSSLVATILNSLPIMFDVMVLFLFMLIMFGTIATQLLGGHLEKRCIYTNPVGDKFVEFATNEDLSDFGEYICQNQKFCDDQAESWNLKTKCEYWGNPTSDTYCFDNIMVSIMNIFEMITLEGWTDMMYIVRDAENTLVYDLFFLSCVIVGNFIILNLMVAVQSAYLDKAFDEEEARKKEYQDKIEAKKRLKQEIENAQEYDDESDSEEDIDPDEVEEDSADGRGGRRSTRRKQVKKGLCDIKKPPCLVESSKFIESIVKSKYFEQLIIALILLNTLSLASEHYEEHAYVTEINVIANLFFTIIFALEMVLKLYGLGCRDYVDDNFNNFDAFIVIMSYVELVVPQDESSQGGGGLGMLRAFRLLRIFKIIKSWESLKVLLSTVFESLQAITNLGVLIVLFLFIFALLCKQFFSEPLKDDGGDDSRYSFTDTFTALITMFIILTGENWNEVMILVISKEQNFAPAYLFISMMLLGNFMLLNLFLAILLKSISEIGQQDEENEKAEKGDEDDENKNGLNGGLNESAPLNSSNSNIEEEFEQIKSQLMALSNKMNAQLDGKLNNDDDAGSQASAGEKKENEVADQFNNQQNGVEEEDDQEKYKKQKSLFIFKYDNPIRSFLRDIISNSYFAGFIYHMIALNSLLLALDMPDLKDKFQKDTIEFLLETISIIFVIEFVIRVIVMGFYWGERTYLRDPWNILDGIIVLFSFVTWFLEVYGDNTEASALRGFRALRALRPLRVVSKNEGIKTVVNALLESIPALINVLLIVMLFLLVFGILGIQLFKGQLGVCTDGSEDIKNKSDCIGQYLVPILDKFGQIKEVNIKNNDEWNITNTLEHPDYPDDKNLKIEAEYQDRVWQQPFNRYDNIFISMMTFFEISTLEMWPDMMFSAIDAVGYDLSPKEKNTPSASLLYVVYIFVTTFFIMNLFISVIVDKFNEQIKKRQGSDNFSNEQKEWVKIQRLLVHTNPKIIPVEPINCFRLQCFRVVQSQAFEYLVMFAIIVNTLFLCIDYHQKSTYLTQVLQEANLVFVVFFTIEMVIKITAYGWKYYWYVNWNKFDFIIVMLSLIAVDEELLKQLNFNVTALRIMRVSRLFRMVKTSEGLRTLLKTLFMSMSNIINTAALLTLILFTFSVAGMSLFGDVGDGEFMDHNVNFKTFYIAMMTLFRASTGESWNGIMHDCYYSQDIIAVFFWTAFQLMSFFIFMNVFIAVIGESFDDNQQTEDENDILALKKKDIKAFQNTWAKYNPMGELYMRTIRLPDFLRELPPPLGYQGIRIEESKLNKIIFCLNIRDHLGRVYYPEVMWTIFHSIAGMNDEKVLNCEQINNILKVVKHKYKGLGKKINLDTLCGNKYYRKELTAIKYIQAMKILTKWRNFKNQNKKNKDQVMMQQSSMHGQNDEAAPRAQIYEVQDGADRNSNAMYLGGDRSQGKAQMNSNNDMIEQRLKNINKQIEANRAQNTRDQVNISQQPPGRQIQLQQEDDQQSYGEEDDYAGDPNSDHQFRNDGREQGDDSVDLDNMPITERNQHTNRNQQRLGQYTRDQDNVQNQGRRNLRNDRNKDARRYR